VRAQTRLRAGGCAACLYFHGRAGILASSHGKVRCCARRVACRLDPATDKRLTGWEGVHQLVRSLEAARSARAALVAKLGSKAEITRELPTLYMPGERKKRAAEALSYNGLVAELAGNTRLTREPAGLNQAGKMFEKE